MKEHIAKLHRLIAASQATMAEYSEMMKVVNEMIELEVKLTTERQSNEEHIRSLLYPGLKKSPPIEQTGGGNGELWEKELFESSLRPVLKKYPTSDEFIIASNQYDKVKL